MAAGCTILLLEDEPMILMDLEFAAQDRRCDHFSAHSCSAALNLIDQHASQIDVAVLDVSLGEGATCYPVAIELDRHGIPYLLHTGDLDRHDEHVRDLDAALIAKPASADRVIGAAIELASGSAPPAD